MRELRNMGTPWGHQERPEGHHGDIMEALKDTGIKWGHHGDTRRDLKNLRDTLGTSQMTSRTWGHHRDSRRDLKGT